MKERLENLANNWNNPAWWANGATNLATNTLAAVGAVEGVKYLESIDASTATTAIAAGLAGAALYKLNDSNLVKKAASKVNSGLRSISGKAMPYVRTAGLAGYMTFAAISGKNAAYGVIEDFSKDKEIPEMSEPTPEPYKIDKKIEDSMELMKRGLMSSPEELILTARGIYFEGWENNLIKGKKQLGKSDSIKLRQGMDAIAHVMYNRFKFDSIQTVNGKERQFTRNENDNIFDVFSRKVKKGKNTVYQFTALRDQAEYFEEHRGIPRWGIESMGAPQIRVGKMRGDVANIAYEALVDALTGKTEDPTNGALFYQNPAAVDKHNKNWFSKKGHVKKAKINSHVFSNLKGWNKWDSKDWKGYVNPYAKKKKKN